MNDKLVLTITGIIYSDYRLTGDTSTDQVEWIRMEYTVQTLCQSKRRLYSILYKRRVKVSGDLYFLAVIVYCKARSRETSTPPHPKCIQTREGGELHGLRQGGTGGRRQGREFERGSRGRLGQSGKVHSTQSNGSVSQDHLIDYPTSLYSTFCLAQLAVFNQIIKWLACS